MRIAYREDGTAMPIYEPGDYVRLVQDEPGPIVMARAGEWGAVLRNRGVAGLDIRLAGHSRPRTTDIPIASGIPSRIVVPCDELGLRIDLQRDLRRDGRGARRRA